MKYELALKLKMAGFPDETPELGEERYQSYVDKDGHWANVEFTDSVYCPSLHELIQACGKDFDKLRLQGDRLWTCFGHEFNGFDGMLFQNHETPEDAVAHLWLTLNVKYELGKFWVSFLDTEYDEVNTTWLTQEEIEEIASDENRYHIYQICGYDL